MQLALRSSKLYIIFNLSAFQMPDMLAEFCTESLVWVSERKLVVRVSGLKRVLSKGYVGLSWPVVLHCHCGLVDHGNRLKSAMMILALVADFITASSRN